MSSEPLPFYRLWCGKRRYSGWKPTWIEAVEAGLPHKVTFQSGSTLSLGPLAWVERGERKYARSRTISIGRDLRNYDRKSVPLRPGNDPRQDDHHGG